MGKIALRREWSTTPCVRLTYRHSAFILVVLLLFSGLSPSLTVSVKGVCPATCRYVPVQYATIQEAINAANVNDTILVSAGTYAERFVLNKTIHLIGSDMSTTFINGQRAMGVINVTAGKSSITGFTLSAAAPGGSVIRVDHANGLIINNTIITADLVSSSPRAVGILLDHANNTVVDRNTFSRALTALNITGSYWNRITNNKATSSVVIGVVLADSAYNVIGENFFVGGSRGLTVSGSLTAWNNVTRNLIRGMNETGILLSMGTSLNIFSENTFELNSYGVDLQGSSGNMLYRNNFLRSSKGHVHNPVASVVNVWDNRSLGGRRGGNYWDNYNGTDADGDGVGDTSFIIDSSNKDVYPLMTPPVPVPLAVASIVASTKVGLAPLTVTFNADVIGTSKPFSYSWIFGDRSNGSNETSPTHRFTAPGNYTVVVLVHDASNTYSSRSLNILVLAGGQPWLSGWYLVGLVSLVAGIVAIGFASYWRRSRDKAGDRAVSKPQATVTEGKRPGKRSRAGQHQKDGKE